MNELYEKYCQDMQAWDACAEIYERQIVSGHPDITAYEEFEEDFFDRILRFLAETQERPIKLMDIGCGSGRLHVRYGAKTANVSDLEKNHPLVQKKAGNSKLAYDRLLNRQLKEVWGIDFSHKMLDLARRKIKGLDLDSKGNAKLTLEQGSAFELKNEPDDVFPVAVCLVNSIGVMQGPEGAQELFKSMRRAVEKAGGIAIISNYQKEYIETYGLGQYESTMDVSGQPWWMVPDTYANLSYFHIPKSYKRAFSCNPELIVDVYDREGHVIQKDFTLTRDPKRTAQVINSGKIRTHTDYESNWYAFDLIESWVRNYWGKAAWHIPTIRLDALRAEPAQFSILDVNQSLKPILERWNIV